MRVGNFSLMIPEGREYDNGHIGLVHGSQYGIRLLNHTDRRVDAELNVDGKTLAVFRLDRWGSALIETPPDDQSHGRFTFYKTASAEGDVAGADDVTRDDRGLISVMFRPERYSLPTSPPIGILRGTGLGQRSMRMSKSGGPCGQSMSAFGVADEKTSGGIEAGVTGLSGNSGQRFREVGPIEYASESEWVTISLRLVAVGVGETVRPLRASGPGRANPVPPAV